MSRLLRSITGSQHSTVLLAILAAACICGAATLTRAADTEKVLASFSGQDGSNPQAGLIFDAKGNLYGTTSTGGFTNCVSLGSCGTVFRLSPGANGTWHKTVLHRFTGNDGAYPMGALVEDKAGNLYGTTSWGANSSCSFLTWVGCGVVFELSPGASNTWTFRLIHRFNGSDGANPSCTLILDSFGNLYGTTTGGPSNGAGTVFELQRGQKGSWLFKKLYAFNGVPDGTAPSGSLGFDTAGNLYGTTTMGGTSNTGTVFELSPTGSGGWIETVLYSFLTNGGTNPANGVILDSTGNLYGTTASSGGTCGCDYGTVFELTAGTGGTWTKTTLHTFTSSDGHNPEGLVFDTVENLFGVTFVGGSSNDGTVFELSPSSGGMWTETQLHVFSGADGAGPVGSLIFDSSGNLYGASGYGGSGNNKGTVFKVALDASER